MNKAVLIFSLGSVGLIALAGWGIVRPAQAAEASYAWEKLRAMRRIAIVPPCYAEEIVTRPSVSEKEQAYQSILQELAKTLYTFLPSHLASNGRFRIAPDALIRRVLAAHRWTPSDFFASRDRQKSARWPAPDRARVAALAKRLRVDGILLIALREPASIGEGMEFHHDTWNPNPLNWRFQHMRAHVVSPRVRACLLTATGDVAWQDEQMAYHPRTQPRTERTLRADWLEATEQVAEQLVESLAHSPPGPMPSTSPNSLPRKEGANASVSSSPSQRKR